MAGKVSTLTWDAPPDGGSDITSYRVLVYEADQQVDSLTSDQPGVQVTASETVQRTALIQALNDLGYSAPAILAIPIGSDTSTAGAFLLSGGGTLTAIGVSPTTTMPSPNPTLPGYLVTAGDRSATITLTSPAGSYDRLDLAQGGTVIVRGVTLPYTVTGLTNGQSYGFYLNAWRGDQVDVGASQYVTPAASPAAGDPSLTITRGGDGRLTFSVATSSGQPIALYFYSSASGNDGLYTGNVPNPFTADLDGYTGPDAVAAYPKWRVRVNGIYSNYVNTPASGPLTVPVYRLVPGDQRITVEQTSPGGGYDRLDLVRNNQAYRTGITLPFVDDQLVNGVSYSYWVTAAQGTNTQAGPTLSARPAPPLAVGPEGTAQGRSFTAGFIETAPEFTADGVATWSTANKSPSANETAFTTSFGRARIPMWFKFHLSAPQIVRISGLPSNTNLGFFNADSPTASDTFAYLFSGPSGSVTDADLASSVLSIIAADDDGAGSGQPYLNQQLAAGWYYILIAGYSQNATIADGRLAFRFMP